MKKFLLALVLMVPMLAFTGCGEQGSKDEPLPQKENVEVSLDYAFFESGSMSRSGEIAYQAFYNDYVKTKKIAPKSYKLTFKAEGGAVAQSVSGPWAGASIKLREGKYVISGTSYPSTYYDSNYNAQKYTSDSLFIKFEEPVSIDKSTNKLTLSAKYGCFLLLFKADNIKQISSAYDYHTATAPKLAGDVYYLFVKADVYSNNGNQYPLSVKVTRNDGTQIETTIGGMGFEVGKYYYFNDMTNSFDIDPMPNGN